MKLIDSDKAYELLDQFFAEIQKHDYKTNQQMMDKVWKAWCELPAAYDVDKVVEELEGLLAIAEKNSTEYDKTGGSVYLMDIYDTMARTYKNAIRIAKSGLNG